MKKLQSKNYTIEIGDILKSSLAGLLKEKYPLSKKVIIVDENTQEHCLPYLIPQFDALNEAEIIVLPAGEENKVLDICTQVWESFTEYNINRNDLIINLGGGVITDMGGFIASLYKRGIDFINIPTTLLAMVDASTGGKTGVDLNNYKNQLGVFADPQLVICDPIFLKTIPQEEFLSGKAEMLKHGILSSKKNWDLAKVVSPNSLTNDDIYRSVKVKNELVLADPTEKNLRKKLNVGHTIGHAIESFLLIREKQPHGYCVAWGMLAEAHLALMEKKLAQDVYHEVREVITTCYPKLTLNEDDIEPIIELMLHDKKNNSRDINFNLIEGFGNVTIDYSYCQNEIHTALNDLFSSEL